MYQILAFGDSLTWGADPATGLRHPPQAQWPRALETGLTGARVHADGVGGRTTCRDDDAGAASRNGAKALPVALSAHMPLDLVILMLGTNDLKAVHGGLAASAQAGMRRLAEIVATFPYKPRSAVPKLLIIAPPPCGAGAAGGRRVEESLLLAPLYRQLAAEVGAGFFDAGSVAHPSAIDGVHLEAKETAALGRALVGPVRVMLA
ncbi:SGNH/GDSL hydrolase family protein [Pseudotabrizicola sp. 4114]|uniref:SGNH/GDSL hydrolase family protein n=1 Tax=Pseudotabrizicola sp. 4114 TaxID=2817731 RepID=UPI00285EF380|nr:lysophospholipase L1-like esterase [Pseudorhodobacter sp. 4114]